MVDWHQSNRGVSLCISIYLLLFVIVVVLSVSFVYASLLFWRLQQSLSFAHTFYTPEIPP